MVCAIAYPCIGPRCNACRIKRSNVPCSKLGCSCLPAITSLENLGKALHVLPRLSRGIWRAPPICTRPLHESNNFPIIVLVVRRVHPGSPMYRSEATMPTNEEGEFELVLGNKQLLSVFFIVVVL